ncbi:DUF3558 domain-containing protein [Tsukamurella pulmonis]|nr:DUF3558 domain-containing protein [Tsukamurella pulmonis]
MAIALTVLLSGCTVAVPGEPTATSDPRTSAKPLPFTPKINGRTNERTDGTSFEPCNAYTDADLRALDINPASIHDAAQVDFPNYRGCGWRGNGYTAARGGVEYSQIVGRELTLDEYKKQMKRLPWQPDRFAHGRPIAVAIENDYCVANFASEESIVTTIVASNTPSPGNTVECDKAVAFASLAITKAP